MKKIVCGIIVFLLSLSSIRAYECSASDKQRLQKLANNIAAILDYEIDNKGRVYFIATLTGVSSELIVRSNANVYDYYFPDDSLYEIQYKLDKKGSKYEFVINGKQDGCMPGIIRTITINTPYYNKYYDDPVCKGIESYSLCQRWNKMTLSYDDFVRNVNEYKKRINAQNNNENNNNNFNFFDTYQKYYWPSLIALIVVLSLLIFLWIKENKKNKL